MRLAKEGMNVLGRRRGQRRVLPVNPPCWHSSNLSDCQSTAPGSAVVSPTSRIPKAKRNRARVVSLLVSNASQRFAADFSPMRSNPASISGVRFLYRSAGDSTTPFPRADQPACRPAPQYPMHAGSEMFYRLFTLCRAKQSTAAAQNHTVTVSYQVGNHIRTLSRHLERRCTAIAFPCTTRTI